MFHPSSNNSLVSISPITTPPTKVPRRNGTMDTQWSDLTVSALKKKCAERGLPKSGVKVDLLNRLREHDEKYSRSAAPEPPGRHYDHYHVQYGRGERSSQDVPRMASTMGHPSEGTVRRDQGHSTGDRANTAGPTEGEFEQILRDNYLTFENDPKGQVRKSTTLAEYNLNFEEAKKKRDATITKAETKFKNDMTKLEKDRQEK
jgi:hypothetical protein